MEAPTRDRVPFHLNAQHRRVDTEHVTGHLHEVGHEGSDHR
ncbi:hypothetical protein SAMN05192568_107118 [Methylobacterium pseudosasicola]|uniref:Uncharacterized protein n=1 Tax=Methylobacterium pseudosasicola TaxID=582667 RepID=A0A1I4UI94_9HYPH|nr:hypothetical protein SAMN05192568_107118 [Methylobacterium pseudosasicola]